MFGDKDDYNENEGLKPEKSLFSINKTNLIVFIKIITIIAIIVSILYVIRYLSEDEKSKIYLSKTEALTRADAKSQSSKAFNSGDLIYFYIESESSDFGNTMLEIQVSIKQDDNYEYFKKVIYEMVSGTASFTAVIPRSYVEKSGNYRISVYIKGEEITRQDIVIN